jgi:sugar lactone lactonase YvrE
MQARLRRRWFLRTKISSARCPRVINIAFGGDDWRTLYFTSRTHLGSVNLKIAGIPVPAPKRS